LLRNAFADVGFVCRYGGEEFCVMLPEHDVRMAEQLAEQVRQQLEQVRLDSPAELRISASIGVSDLSHDAADPQDLINQADVCLYVAKRQGRNRVIVFQPQYAAMATRESDGSPADDEQPSPEMASGGSTSIPFPAVAALVSALAYRDADTADHSRRVADLCVSMASGWMDAKQTHLLEIAALLHDIGKIGIPDDILLKPGRLTEKEWALMAQQQHIGIEIIATTFHCEELTEITRTRNACYGGDNEQPHLPTGNDIPLAARILAICDSYDAMTFDRPFRQGRRHAEAATELRRCAGTQFDPELVERFLEKIEELREIEQERGESVAQRLSLEIGHQIERIAEAADDRDEASVNALASRLAKVAKHEGHQAIAKTASSLADEVSAAEQDWAGVVEITNELFRLCQQTRSSADSPKAQFPTPPVGPSLLP
jgi:HD-GYP domain-containing protein (c-di-GMP phosphodiesterase class II)